MKDTNFSPSTIWGISLGIINILVAGFFTNMGFMSAFITLVAAAAMLLWPWLWIYAVPSKWFHETAPPEYVVVFAWGILLFESAQILLFGFDYA